MTDHPMGGRWRTGRRRALLVGLVMFVFIVGAPLLLYQVSVQPGAAIVRWAFEAGEESEPAVGLHAVGDDVSVQVGVPVPVSGAPDASLDIYTAARAGASGEAQGLSGASGAEARPIVLWIHGGGFIANSAWMVHAYAARLARSGYVVASLDYALAPAARYPTPVRQADAALAFLREHAADYGGDPQRFILGGDSAGARSRARSLWSRPMRPSPRSSASWAP